MNKKLITILLSNYGAVISLGLYTPIFALFVVELGGTAKEAGIATAIYYFMGGIFMLMLRLLINNSKKRPHYYITGNALETVSALILIMVSSLGQLYFVQILHAFSTALRVPSQRALFAHYEDKGREGSEWAMMEGGDFIILGLSAALGGFIVSTLSFDSVFMLMASIQGLTTIYCIKLLSKKKRRR